MKLKFVVDSDVGIQVSTVDCWRPYCKCSFSELRRFFIGGCPELEDLTYTAVPSAFEVTATGQSLLL